MTAMKKILCGSACSLIKKITALRSDQRGASALEFAIVRGHTLFWHPEYGRYFHLYLQAHAG